VAEFGDLSGPDKAAVFLLFMGEEFTSEIFKKLDERDIRTLGASMAKIDNVPPGTLDSLLHEFALRLSSGEGGFLVKGESFLKRAITKAVGTRKAEALIGEMGEDSQPRSNVFEGLKTADPRVIAEFIRSEHPQTIALIMAHMDPAQSGQVLLELPEHLQSDVVLRVARLEGVPPDVVSDIDRLLNERLQTLASTEGGYKVGGVHTVAEMLNRVDSTTEGAILTRIEEESGELADEIRQCMFVFEDLINIDDRGIMALMREVANDDLTLALKTATGELKDKIMSNVSERARMVIEEDLDAMGPVRLRDVEAAQQRIVRVAKKLEEEGKLAIAGKGGDDIFV
jgi:flagellar motor switch protein FliG